MYGTYVHHDTSSAAGAALRAVRHAKTVLCYAQASPGERDFFEYVAESYRFFLAADDARCEEVDAARLRSSSRERGPCATISMASRR